MDQADIVHLIVLPLLVVTCLIFSAIYLASIKIKSPAQRNAGIKTTEALQVYKTILVIFGLFLYMPIEIFSVFVSGGPIICIARGMFENLLLESQPLTLLALAIVRLRTILSIGKSVVLVTKSFAYFTLSICQIFPVLSSVVTFISLFNSIKRQEPNYLTDLNYTTTEEKLNCHWPNGSFKYRIFTLVSLDIIPIGITCSLYIIIYSRLSAQGRMPNINRLFSNNFRERLFSDVKQTIITLLLTLTISWFPYLVVEVHKLDAEKSKMSILIRTSVYVKIVIYALHPLIEGILHKRGRKSITLLFRRICSRSKIGINHNSETGRNADFEFSIQRASRHVEVSQLAIRSQQITESNAVSKRVFSEREEAVYVSSCESCEDVRSSEHDCHQMPKSWDPKRSAIFCVVDDATVAPSPWNRNEYATMHTDFDGVMAIQKEEHNDEVNDIMHRRIKSSVDAPSIETTDTQSPCSNASGKPFLRRHSCQCINITKVFPHSAIPQEGRRRRHSLWHKKSSKTFLIATISSASYPEGPVWFEPGLHF